MNVTQAQSDTLARKAEQLNRPDLVENLEIVADDDYREGDYIGFWHTVGNGRTYYGIEKDGYCHT